jgi:hypothetical protein
VGFWSYIAKRERCEPSRLSHADRDLWPLVFNIWTDQIVVL